MNNSSYTAITENHIEKIPYPLQPLKSFAFKWIQAAAPALFCLVVAKSLPPWAFMWVLAGSLFIGAKWVTIADLLAARALSLRRVAAYAAWPGLNPIEFCRANAEHPQPKEWFAALAKMFFGAVIVWGWIRHLPPGNPMLVGWTGLVGMAFVLHFGAFHLLSILWRAAGFNAQPLMRNPAAAASVASFWGGRWNRAFSDLMTPHVFAPAARRFGTATATVIVFLFSGLLHELVISIPARGGFGLPTLYFATQAAGLLFERSRFGRKCGLGRELRGFICTIAVTAGPVYWLFHPIFIRNVILPMLHAIGAT